MRFQVTEKCFYNDKLFFAGDMIEASEKPNHPCFVELKLEPKPEPKPEPLPNSKEEEIAEFNKKIKGKK